MRPSPGLQPATRRWRAFVRRPSGRPASTKHTSATAARRSPVPCARRPRSRLGSPARLSRSGGRLRFRQASSPPVQARRFAATFPVSPQPAFIHARSTALPNCFCPFLRRQPARLRSSSVRITPLLFANPTKCKKKQPPHPKRRAAVAAEARSSGVFQLSGLWPGWFIRLSRKRLRRSAFILVRQSFGVNRPLHPSFTSFGRGSAMAAV